jgi:hypothetical protein
VALRGTPAEAARVTRKQRRLTKYDYHGRTQYAFHEIVHRRGPYRGKYAPIFERYGPSVLKMMVHTHSTEEIAAELKRLFAGKSSQDRTRIEKKLMDETVSRVCKACGFELLLRRFVAKSDEIPSNEITWRYSRTPPRPRRIRADGIKLGRKPTLQKRRRVVLLSRRDPKFGTVYAYHDPYGYLDAGVLCGAIYSATLRFCSKCMNFLGPTDPIKWSRFSPGRKTILLKWRDLPKT